MFRLNWAMVVAVVLTAGLTGEAWAAARVTSAQRGVRVFAGDAFDDQIISEDSSALGLFDESLTLTFFSEDGDGGGHAEASQTSTITLDTVSGVAAGTATGGGGVGTGSAGGRSSLQALITVDQTTPFVLDGSITVLGSLFSRVEVLLERTAPDAESLFFAKVGEEAGEGTIDFSGSNQVTGVLTPGSYSFAALAWAIDSDFIDSETDFNVSLTVPEPHCVFMMAACCMAGLRWRARNRAAARK